MDMGMHAAGESMMIGGAIVGLLCVLPMFILLSIIVLSFWFNKKDK